MGLKIETFEACCGALEKNHKKKTDPRNIPKSVVWFGNITFLKPYSRDPLLYKPTLPLFIDRLKTFKISNKKLR